MRGVEEGARRRGRLKKSVLGYGDGNGGIAKVWGLVEGWKLLCVSVPRTFCLYSSHTGLPHPDFGV